MNSISQLIIRTIHIHQSTTTVIKLRTGGGGERAYTSKVVEEAAKKISRYILCTLNFQQPNVTIKNCISCCTNGNR